jgi:hypothetical protein
LLGDRARDAALRACRSAAAVVISLPPYSEDRPLRAKEGRDEDALTRLHPAVDRKF